jgi:hypothetical protein
MVHHHHPKTHGGCSRGLSVKTTVSLKRWECCCFLTLLSVTEEVANGRGHGRQRIEWQEEVWLLQESPQQR